MTRSVSLQNYVVRLERLRRASYVLNRVRARNRSVIQNRKRYGVKKDITGYARSITDAFFDEDLLHDYLRDARIEFYNTENWSDVFAQYLLSVNTKLADLFSKADEFIRDSFIKGGKRVLDEEGSPVIIDEVRDDRAIRILVSEQDTYYKGLSKRLSRKADRIISDGLRQGLPNERIVKDLIQGVKGTTKASAMRIARSEIVKAHSVGQAQTMIEAGIEHYHYINSPDYTGVDGKRYPCIICRNLQGAKGREHVYVTRNAGDENNPLPVVSSHPQCNCSVVAVLRKQGESLIKRKLYDSELKELIHLYSKT